MKIPLLLDLRQFMAGQKQVIHGGFSAKVIFADSIIQLLNAEESLESRPNQHYYAYRMA
jgi:hypothetical protein